MEECIFFISVAFVGYKLMFFLFDVHACSDIIYCGFPLADGNINMAISVGTALPMPLYAVLYTVNTVLQPTILGMLLFFPWVPPLKPLPPPFAIRRKIVLSKVCP